MSSMNIQDTICSMEHLKREGYVFRGLKDSAYQLLPNGFRPESIAKMSANFGVAASVAEDWLNCLIPEGWLPGSDDYGRHPTIKRLKAFCLYLMHYNYGLHLFVHNNKASVSKDDRDRLLRRDMAFWQDSKTFQYLFEAYLPTIINRYDLGGKLIQRAQPFEDLAGVDETLPQHYGYSTAAMDGHTILWLPCILRLVIQTKKQNFSAFML